MIVFNGVSLTTMTVGNPILPAASTLVVEAYPDLGPLDKQPVNYTLSRGVISCVAEHA